MSAGFQLRSSRGVGDFTGAGVQYDIPSDNGGRLAVGDLVTLGGDSNIVDGEAEIVRAGQAASCIGVITSISPDIANESFSDAGGIAASVAGKCMVVTDEKALFEVECSATVPPEEVGENADAVITEATQTGGLTISNMTLDQNTTATTNTLHFKIHGLLKGITSGTLGDRAIVSLNGTFNNTGATGK